MNLLFCLTNSAHKHWTMFKKVNLKKWKIKPPVGFEPTITVGSFVPKQSWQKKVKNRNK